MKHSICDPTAFHVPIDQQNFLLGCFAISLLKGDNILGKNFKGDTVHGYLRAAGELYEDTKTANPYSYEVETNFPRIIVDALRKYEKIEDRREIITDSMFQYMDEVGTSEDVDSLEAALNDWFKWGRYSGPRRREWCQTRKSAYDTVDKGPDEAAALIASDVVPYDSTGTRLNARICTLDDIECFTVRWRWQKNGDNGETLKYYRDRKNEKWCPCRALWNIVQHAICLGVKAHEPLGQYRDDRGRVFYIRDTDVNKQLQDAAKTKLGITDTEDLSRWTTHSLRVTASNELHRLGFHSHFIMHRLRWKSETFMRYLRHTIHVARQHTEAMNLSKQNLTLEHSNIATKNDRMNAKPNIYRESGDDDILWGIVDGAKAA